MSTEIQVKPLTDENLQVVNVSDVITDKDENLRVVSVSDVYSDNVPTKNDRTYMVNIALLV